MKLFTTRDVSASVHLAYDQFTHVVLNRGYTLIRPVHFRTSLLDDLPVYQYASWIPASRGQLAAWLAAGEGGVLVEQDPYPAHEHTCDVTVSAECPYAMQRIEACNARNAAYGVIPHPGSWKTHEDCVDLRFPPPELMQAVWRVCAGQSVTNAELAEATGLPVPELQYLKNALKPVEYWHVQKRLAPERDFFVPAWDWVKDGAMPKNEVTKAGFKAQLEEMARFGYIALKKRNHYPAETPDWEAMQQRRATALNDLAAVRTLVDSLPDHLAT